MFCHLKLPEDLKVPYRDNEQQIFVPEEATPSIEIFELTVVCECLNWNVRLSKLLKTIKHLMLKLLIFCGYTACYKI